MSDRFGVLPEGLELARTTPVFTSETTPPALRKAHLVADEAWGLLCVREGEVTFTFEHDGSERTLGPDDEQVIPPGVYHAVAPSGDARYVVEFYRPI